MVTYYLFKGLGQGMKIAFISRDNIRLATSKTNLEFVDVSDTFYDTLIEKERCITMNEDDFDETIMATGMKLGYTPVRKEVEIKLPDGSTGFKKYEAKLRFVEIKESKVEENE